ncbi:kinase-like domain-containing protein [Aspergillus spinulosporus]
MSMSTSMPSRSLNPTPHSLPELTTTASVHHYLESLVLSPSISPSRNITPLLTPRAIRRITLGSTNYTYRLFLDAEAPYTDGATTAILKYASSYTAAEPRVSFSPERQVFEVRAMARVPWGEILGQASSSGGDSKDPQGPEVKIPRVYFEDPARRVIIMEDGTPRGVPVAPGDRDSECGQLGDGETGENGNDHIWEEQSHSSRIFLEEVPPSPEKYATASLLGKTLGKFLARMHNWGRGGEEDANVSANATPWVRESFGGNTYARDLTIQEAIGDFWTSVRCCTADGDEIPILGTREDEVRGRLEKMRRAILTDTETFVMGDLRLGNVLLTFSPSPSGSSTLNLQTLSIIDWEFAMAAPAFIDIGNFIGEVFLIHYFESNDEVYTILLEAFIAEYEAHTPAEVLDIEMILSYAGAHIVQALPRRINSPRSRAKKGNAGGCLRHALDFIMNTNTSRGTMTASLYGSLQELLGIMRGHRPGRDLSDY